MNRDNFNTKFLGLCVIYSQQDNLEQLADIYFNFLNAQGFTDEDFQEACNHVMSTNVYNTLPKPAEFIQSRRGDVDAQALLAMEVLENAMRDNGSYVSVTFEDKILMDVVANHEGGWAGFGEITTEEWVWVKKEFIKIYKAKLLTGSYDKSDYHLKGIEESNPMNKDREHKVITVSSDKPEYIEIEHKPVEPVEPVKQIESDKVEMPTECRDAINKLGRMEG